MRITRDNLQEFTAAAEELKDALDSAIEAAEAWEALQDEPKTEDTADEIRSAREELEEALGNVDAATVCQLVHGKHRGKSA